MSEENEKQLEMTAPGFEKNPLEDLMVLVRHMRKIEEDENAAEALLATIKETKRNLQEITLPAAFANLGLEELTLNTGERIVITETVFANISKARREAAYQWLKDHGAGALVKKEMTIAQDRVDEAMLMCRTSNIPFNLDETVNAQSLKKFVRETLDAGEDIPHDLFGIHTQKSAVVK
jgi:hypothetical protein